MTFPLFIMDEYPYPMNEFTMTVNNDGMLNLTKTSATSPNQDFGKMMELV